MKRMLLSLLLMAALLLSLFPLCALAEGPAEGEAEAEAETEESAEESREGLGNLWGIPADDVLYLGYYADKPVAWLVLDADQTNMYTEGVYLFSRDLIDSTKVRFDESSTLWEGSLAQEWCTNFAESAFSEAESALIPPTDKVDPTTYPDHLFGLTWRETELKGEKIFFLSVLELAQYYGSYGPENKRTIKRCSMESYYWLRSPHYYHDDYHGIVLQDSYIHDKLPYEPWAARPCANLYIQDAVWALPADDEGAPGAVPLPAQQEREIHEWKLIVLLAEHSFLAETTAAENGELTVSYSGADVGEGARLTLLVRDAEGKPLSLRRLEQPAAAEGSLKLNLQELELPEGAALYLFCEQLNEVHVSNYASPLQELKTDLPAPATPAPATPVPETPAPENGGDTAAEPGTTPRPEGKTEGEPAGQAQSAPAEKPRENGDGTEAEGLRQKVIEYYPAVALGVFLLLAVALIAVASYRRSLLPVILLILLMLLTAVVYLRLCEGHMPERLFGLLQDLF